jgi:hypothetical protein
LNVQRNQTTYSNKNKKTMKKIALIVFALFMMLGSYAQIGKGSFLLTGSVACSSYNNSWCDSLTTYDNKQTNYSVSPGIGFFAANNFAVGLGIEYFSNSGSSSYNNIFGNYYSNTKSSSTSRGLEFSPYAAYYFRLSDNAYISATATFGYQMLLSYSHKNETQSTATYTLHEYNDVDSYQINASLLPGLVYFLNQKLALKASIGGLFYNYSYFKNKNVSYDNYEKYSSTGLNFNMSSVSFGIQYFFLKY